VNSNRKAQTATVLLIAALGAFVLWRESGFGWQSFDDGGTPVSPEPQDAIYQALDAIREGNMRKYLDAHTPVMQASLARAAAESGEVRLMQALQAKNAALKGVAVQAPQRFSESEIKVKVEYIFADRNEAQIYSLERATDRWKIARTDAAERVETSVPYGTPVMDTSPRSATTMPSRRPQD
jgi:hypothetical protein